MDAPVVVNEGEVDIASSVYAAAKPMASLLAVTLCLALDELNPVKVFCCYSRGVVTERHVGYFAAMLLCALTIHQRGRVLYTVCRLFFRCTFNNMFFRSVEVVGLENLPKEGPVILTGNHNNQFVDGVILLTNCHREISFMIAEKSYQRPFVGFLARAFNCIPVSRPQDTAYAGAGTVTADGSSTLRGEGTSFTKEVQAGNLLEVKGLSKSVKVKDIVSDVELTLEAEAGESASGCRYKVFPKVDQSLMYATVHHGLKMGKCLGIFPEGGSHDRTDLLPLKAGVAIIALDAFSKHGLLVPIVPVGLNYFHGHKFGGRVVVEFGAPINIPESIHAQYETDKRGAADALLGMVATGMRGVIVPVPDYRTLQQIYMVRRLYVPDGLKISAEKAMDLNRRFAVGTFRIMQLALGDKAVSNNNAASGEDQLSAGGEGVPSEEVRPQFQPEDINCIQELRSALEAYMSSLKRLGLRDHQVRQIGWWSMGDLVGRLMYLLVTMALGCIPQVMFNLPVWFIATRIALKEQQKSLKASSVKLKAYDVVMSYKIIYVLAFVPFLYLVYGVLIWRYSRWSTMTMILVLATLPFFSFLGMKASEQGIRAYTDIVPLFMRLLPSTKAEQDALPARRAALQRRLHTVVKTFGPKLGDLYWQKEVDWSKEMASSLSSSVFGELLAASKGARSEGAVSEATRRSMSKKI
eukprot:CAMPEP_0175725048 /NCGR_PEP_ID=MMETSP0097-20121207/47563_1 /TAXON_ID=311494 /ORGANISM="Alexandrium monilatum, Strain CCMP3105" /LENGTH=692 /DNA_ID=CAMNT_0017032819 /DNA_START=1 /DNA_END=2079 /DNA_ORIENTATION=+